MNELKVSLSRYVDRRAEILDRCRGRRVLHLGCVGFTDSAVADKIASAKKSLHQQVTAIADCVGVDIDARTVGELNQAGVFKNVIVGDVEKLEALPGVLPPFDVVLAGDIIEHLSNPGRMLEGVKRHLKPDGRLIVSTPNAMGLPAYLRYTAGSFREGLQHVLCFNAITLAQMLARHGFVVEEGFSCYQTFTQESSGRAFAIGRAFFRRFPKFGGTLLFVVRLSCQG